MALRTQTREMNEVMVVELGGRLVLGEESTALRTLVRDLVSRGIKRVVFDLRDVSYIDSAGLGVLIAAFSTMKSAGGELKLSSLGERLGDLLQVTRLTTVFEIFDDLAPAVRSFWSECPKCHQLYLGPPPHCA